MEKSQRFQVMQHNNNWRDLIGQQKPRTRRQLSPSWQVRQNKKGSVHRYN